MNESKKANGWCCYVEGEYETMEQAEEAAADICANPPAWEITISGKPPYDPYNYTHVCSAHLQTMLRQMVTEGATRFDLEYLRR